MNNHLGAFVARKKPHVDSTAPQISRDGVEHRIELSVTDIGVFGRQKIPLSIPRQFVIRAANWEAVVANSNNLILIIGDTGTDLGIGIFASFSLKQGHGHKIFITAQIVGSFA